MSEKLSLVFDGRLASSGQLHYYEYSRAAYAYARFVATIETFRRTGNVPQRITGGSNIDLIIESRGPGSFPIDIIAPIVTSVGTELAGIPLKILIEYVLQSIQRLLPRNESALLEAAKIQLAVERERTAQVQSQEESARLASIEKMSTDQNVTIRAALSLLEQAQTQKSSALDYLQDETGDINTLGCSSWKSESNP